MYHNISRKFLESRLQPAILGNHGIDKNALEYFQYVFKAGRYLVLAQKDAMRSRTPDRHLRVFISEVFRFEILGFEQVDEDFYKVYFRDVEIGEFDAEALRLWPVQVMR
jgi:hypothetical protein